MWSSRRCRRPSRPQGRPPQGAEGGGSPSRRGRRRRQRRWPRRQQCGQSGGAGHRRELLHVCLLSARACGPLACLTVVDGGGDRDCSTTRVAFLALPTQLLHARRRRRHLEPATPRLASLRYISKGKKISISKSYLHLHVYYNTIHNSQDMESTKVSINR
ncbi:dual specificity protein phosphatase 22 isoform X6 [Homo sapiens]|uniref:dual specificity protein phosphatase 22 isoform X6 n=1 Tax=Homo sapiens TaxID=9606 RepID=UPI001FB18093|nr:dual specificity protein phosphatase 22 isoform X6 [Homo sapiens]